MSDASAGTAMFEAIWRVLLRRTQERAVAATELAHDMLHMQGPLRRSESELFAGTHIINNDRELLPRVARATGLGISVYLGNRRIATASMLDAGRLPEIGAFADASLVDTVLRRREVFRGTIVHEDRRLLVAARPVYASNRPDDYGPVGMIEAYQDELAFHELLEATARETAGSGRVGLEEQSDRMRGIMHFIDDVSRRLQLLALNGNIIAAQAGEHGRAFRVVCRELSSLAEQAKEAVGEVRKLSVSMGLDIDRNFADDRRMLAPEAAATTVPESAAAEPNPDET